ncbi:membrane protein [Salmonella phage BPS17L1]|uniref:Membrane protein n=1 Tax=Salmonella phage BPS17L1 TaxID=2060122 RepID=A0A2I6PHH6_9CAUD|nr:membrane protein [Salmonella phage BPS17L1]AUM59511.1 membrane protein [Salmonella phage BPS17L1]
MVELTMATLLKVLTPTLHILIFFFGVSVMVWGFSDPQWSFSYRGQMDLWSCFKPFLGLAIAFSTLPTKVKL